MEFHEFKIDARRLMPLLQRDLYRNPDAMIRETLQNALDAITARAEVDTNFDQVRDGRVAFKYDKDAGTLQIADNGAGMSKESLLEVFRYYGRSEKGEKQTGMFGVGAKSIFAVADSFSIHTKSIATGKTVMVYVTTDGLNFVDSPPERPECGTTITVPSASAPKPETVDKYCRAISVPVIEIVNGVERKVGPEKEYADALVLKGNGFDIYLGTHSSRWSLTLLVNGIYLGDEYGSDAVSHAMVNVTRKDLLDVTMSRDNPIKNEKHSALVNAVRERIREEVKHLDTLDTKYLRGGGWKLVAWWHACNYPSAGPDWLKLGESAKENIGFLGTRVFYAKEGYFRMEDTMINAIGSHRKSGVYFSFRRVVDILQQYRPKDDIVIYGWGGGSKQKLREAMQLLGVQELPVEKTSLKVRRQMFNDNGRVSYAEVEKVTGSLLIPDGAPLMVFGVETEPAKIKQMTGSFRCFGIRVTANDRLKTSAKKVDTREKSAIRWMVNGEERTTTDPTADDARGCIAPPALYPIAKISKRDGTLFPADYYSAAKLALAGALPTDNNEVVRIIASAVPEECRQLVKETIFSRCQTRKILELLAQLIASLDWTQNHSRHLFKLAAVEQPEYFDDAYSPTEKIANILGAMSD